jgi:2'-5' RNA ligase
MTQTNLQTYEAAIVALIPEVESLVMPFRVRYDSSAAAGMPAHVTINYPFTPRPIQDDLCNLFLDYPSFEFMLSRVERWPDVLYLAPEPSVPFIELIEHVARRFPESPPYGGLFPDVVPHITVAHTQDPEVLARAAEEFGRVSAGRLPVIARLEELWLMDNQEGRWRKRLRLPLS